MTSVHRKMNLSHYPLPSFCITYLYSQYHNETYYPAKKNANIFESSFSQSIDHIIPAFIPAFIPAVSSSERNQAATATHKVKSKAPAIVMERRGTLRQVSEKNILAMWQDK